MASKQPAHTTQTTEVKLPAWVDAASKENYDYAKQLGSAAFNPYKGDRVADTSPLMKQAYDLISKNSGKAAGIFEGMATDASNFDPGTIAGTDLSQYMNPYTSEVIDKSLADMDKTRAQALMSNASAAQKAGAFGGSRHGIVDAVTNAESAEAAGLLSSQLRSGAYDKAVASAQQDIANRTNTFTSKQGAMGNAATGMQESSLKDFAGLMQGGMQQQAQSQAEIDSAREIHDEKRNFDLENLNLRLSALGMSPYGKSEATDKKTSGGSSGTDIGQLGLGVFSLLLGLSEDDTKTDKEKVGKVPGTDLDMWAFRYKKDPKTYPKVVGVMASDVEEKMPEFVHKVEGKRVIDYGGIMAKAGKAA